MNNLLQGYVKLLNETPYNGRGKIIDELMSVTGWCRDKCYKELAKVGYESRRKTRADKGKTTISEENLELIASLKLSSLRKNDKTLLETPTALAILAQNGVEVRSSIRNVNKILKQRGLLNNVLNTDKSHVSFKTEYPNQMHQVDVSLATLYYSPSSGLKFIKESENYKNKDFWHGRERLKLWRYVLTDHTSCSIVVKYYEASGELQTNMYDFLLYAWGVKSNKLFAFHGVPEVLYWDRGSANTSRAIQNALNSLGVRHIAHETGNARAKGQVETMHNHIEKKFESRLVFQKPPSLEDLNQKVENWVACYNAGTIVGYDSTLKRNGINKNRLELWSRIEENQLRELPDRQICLALLKPDAVKCTVRNDLSITYKHPNKRTDGGSIYYLGNLEGVQSKLKVEVIPLMFDEAGAILVSYTDYMGVEYQIKVKPIEIDVYGFREDAATLDNYKQNRKTRLEKKIEDLTELTYQTKEPKPKAVPFAHMNDGKGLDTLDVFAQEGKIATIPKKGKEIKVDVEIYEEILTPYAVAKRLRSEIEWQPEYLKLLQSHYPDGIAESKLAEAKSLLLKQSNQQSKIVSFKTI